MPHEQTSAFVTIVARNYLGMALATATSARRHHPKLPLYIFVLDDPEATLAPVVHAAGFHFLSPADVAIPDFRELIFRYSVTEACTAVKPFVMRAIFARGYTKLVYMDPDLWCVSPLTEVFKALDEANIVVTPHIVTPIPPQSALSESLLLQVGTFNLGFLGINQHIADALLSWWGNRLLTGCFFDVANGMFFDQKWFDLVPCLFDDVHILKHRGYNVAWWNVHERTIRRHNHQWVIEETAEELRFFHFSSLPEPTDHRLSKNVPVQRTSALYDIHTNSDLNNLFSAYRNALTEHDHPIYAQLPYGFEHQKLDSPSAHSGLKRRWFSRFLNASSRDDLVP